MKTRTEDKDPEREDVKRARRAHGGLRTQLAGILPSLLPDSPGKAIKGSVLLRLVMPRLKGNYKESTVRYHLSVLCGDKASGVHRVGNSQGYYIRSGGLLRIPLSDEEYNLAAKGVASIYALVRLVMARDLGTEEKALVSRLVENIRLMDQDRFDREFPDAAADTVSDMP